MLLKFSSRIERCLFYFFQSNGVELGRLAVHHTMSVAGPATHLLGMNALQVLDDNLDVFLNGISAKEKQVLDEINEK